MTAYRVRFAQAKTCRNEAGSYAAGSRSFDAEASSTRRRSHFGCRECRQRRVKCDETFPICQRCHRRGAICHPNLQTSHWQFEFPWPLVNVDIRVDTRLMRYWLDATSRMLSVDSNNNPFSFPILRYINGSSSLVHFLQSASAAQEECFDQPKMSVSLRERGKAISALRQELRTENNSLSHSFLTMLMLGMSSSWMAIGPTDYGREHLLATRVVADLILEKKDSKKDELDHLTMGTYVYWDMACSFCLDPVDHPIERQGLLETYVKHARYKFHAITTHSIDLYHLLGKLGRYCRVITDGGVRDSVYETFLMESLNEYRSIETDHLAKLLTEAFRKYGLLLLCRFCGKLVVGQPRNSTFMETENYAHQLALEIVELILQTKPDSPYLNIQTIPLLGAGAEMTFSDTVKRNQVIQRLNEVYSTNRLLSTLWIIELLEELWAALDTGKHITWLELMLSKNWRLRIG